MYCKDVDEKIDYETYIKQNIRNGRWHNKKWNYYEDYIKPKQIKYDLNHNTFLNKYNLLFNDKFKYFIEKEDIFNFLRKEYHLFNKINCLYKYNINISKIYGVSVIIPYYFTDFIKYHFFNWFY